MPVAVETTKCIYDSDGTVGPWAYDFKIYAATDLEVSIVDSNGVATLYTYATDYTVTGVGLDAGGEVTFTTVLAIGYKVVIRRKMLYLQAQDYIAQNRFSAQVHNDAIDKLAMQVQQLDERVRRALMATVESPVDESTVVPVANNILACNSAADGWRTMPITPITVPIFDHPGNYTDLASAVAAYGTSKGTLYINQAYYLAGNLTLPKTLTLRIQQGGMIYLNGFKLVAYIEAGYYQVFSGTGTVRLPYNAYIKPHWWGWATDAAYTVNDTAIAAASESIAPSFNTATGITTYGGHVDLGIGRYYCSTVPIYRYVLFFGHGPLTTVESIYNVNMWIIKEALWTSLSGYATILKDFYISMLANTNDVTAFYGVEDVLTTGVIMGYFKIENVVFRGNPAAKQRAVYLYKATGNGIYGTWWKNCGFYSFYDETAAIYMKAGTMDCNKNVMEVCRHGGFNCAALIEGNNNLIINPECGGPATNPVWKTGLATKGGKNFNFSFGEGRTNNAILYTYFDAGVNYVTVYAGGLNSSASTLPVVWGNLDDDQICTPNADEKYYVATGTPKSQYSDTDEFLILASDKTREFYPGRVCWVYCGDDGFRRLTVLSSVFSTNTTVVVNESDITSNMEWVATSGSGSQGAPALRIQNASQSLPNVRTGKIFIGNDDTGYGKKFIASTAHDFSGTPLTVTANSQVSFSLSTPGSTAGGMVTVARPAALNAGVSITGAISSVNTTTIYLRNHTGSDVTLNSSITFKYELSTVV